MTRILTYHAVVTYDLDAEIDRILLEHPDLPREDAEQEARETIEEWAVEDFGNLGFTTVEEDVAE